jgi:hypothetical protein
MAKKDRGINYLDMIPDIKEELEWSRGEDGIVVIIKKNNSFTDKIASFLFKAPKETKVSLDEFGSFVWKQIDGKNTVYEIAIMVKEKFGKKAEPLYERICQYFQTLDAAGFVKVMEKNTDV